MVVLINTEIHKVAIIWVVAIIGVCTLYTCSIWYFIQFVRIAIFMNLHGPAGACIQVVSASPIDVPPIQHVLKHCVHIIYFIR